MGDMHGQVSDTALLAGTGELSDDYELRHILSVASAYLDAGQVSDAEDLLQEAMDADAGHQAVQSLARRLAHIKGVPAPDVPLDSQPLQPDVLVHFTSPLPGASSQSPAIQRLTTASEQYFHSDRVYSALDLTYVLCAEAPDFLAGFVRLAEILIALGNVDQARDLYDTLKMRHEYEDEPTPWLVEALGISLNPGDTSALIGYAMTLIEDGEISALEPFVPEAISRAVDMNDEAALNMASAYLNLQPDNVNAQRLYLKVVAAAGETHELVESARRMVTEGSPLDLLTLRVSAEITDGSAEWISWLERVLHHVRADSTTSTDVLAAIEATPVTKDCQKLVLAKTLVLNACQRWDESLSIVAMAYDDPEATQLELFAQGYARAIAMDATGHADAREAMLGVAQLAYAPEVEAFARNTTLFGESASPSEILDRFIQQSGGDDPIGALTRLRDENPDRLDIRTALADAHLNDGKTFEGIKELRYIAEQHEKAGNLTGMIECMRKISQAVPTNVDMKAKLIDGYLRRGVLDEAVDELESIGGLYEDRNRSQDAVAAFTRAAEIASALGNFPRGNLLFERAVHADPNNVPVRHAAVAFYLQTGSIEMAADQLREVVRIAMAADDKDEAVAALHQIIALAPQDPGAYHKLGEVLTALGEYTQAERVYRRLASFSPHDPVLEAKQSALAVLAATR